MATVTLYQPTDMSALPTMINSQTSSAAISPFEIDIESSHGAVNCLGSFNINFDVVEGGTISRVQIDDGDFGSFPNLDITGLSYSVTADFAESTIRAGDILDLTAAVLAGADTVIGTVGSDRLLGSTATIR